MYTFHHNYPEISQGTGPIILQTWWTTLSVIVWVLPFKGSFICLLLMNSEKSSKLLLLLGFIPSILCSTWTGTSHQFMIRKFSVLASTTTIRRRDLLKENVELWKGAACRAGLIKFCKKRCCILWWCTLIVSYMVFLELSFSKIVRWGWES
jgi:hypothetical protein